MIETRKRELQSQADEQYDLGESCSPGRRTWRCSPATRNRGPCGAMSRMKRSRRRGSQRGYRGGDIDPLPDLEPNEQMSD